MAGGLVGMHRAQAAPSGPVMVTPQNMYSAEGGASSDGLSQARTFADGGIAGLMGQSNPLPQFNIQSGYNNYATPNAPSMQYPQQGQPNQPQQGANPPTLSSQLPSTPKDIGGPDVSGNAPGENMGFDKSGSDAGVGGQPVNQMQTPMQQFADGGQVNQIQGAQNPMATTGNPMMGNSGFGQQAPAIAPAPTTTVFAPQQIPQQPPQPMQMPQQMRAPMATTGNPMRPMQAGPAPALGQIRPQVPRTTMQSPQQLFGRPTPMPSRPTIAGNPTTQPVRRGIR